MKRDELISIEEYLFYEGYKKCTEAKHTSTDAYEWIKSFKDEESKLKYNIIYRIWDFSKYTSEAILDNDLYSIDIVILTDHNGRTDLITKLFNLQDVERFAERYYMFLNNSPLLTNN